MAFTRNNSRSGSGGRRKPRDNFSAAQSRHGQREPLVTVKGRGDHYFIYGWHSVTAALANSRRHIRRVLVTDSAVTQLQENKVLYERAQKCGFEDLPKSRIVLCLGHTMHTCDTDVSFAFGGDSLGNHFTRCREIEHTDADAEDIDELAALVPYRSQPLPYGLKRPSGRGQVTLGYELVLPVY
jgi:hypothetical protein